MRGLNGWGGPPDFPKAFQIKEQPWTATTRQHCITPITPQPRGTPTPPSKDCSHEKPTKIPSELMIWPWFQGSLADCNSCVNCQHVSCEQFLFKQKKTEGRQIAWKKSYTFQIKSDGFRHVISQSVSENLSRKLNINQLGQSRRALHRPPLPLHPCPQWNRACPKWVEKPLPAKCKPTAYNPPKKNLA